MKTEINRKNQIVRKYRLEGQRQNNIAPYDDCCGSRTNKLEKASLWHSSKIKTDKTTQNSFLQKYSFHSDGLRHPTVHLLEVYAHTSRKNNDSLRKV